MADEVKRYHGRDVDAVVHPRMDPIFLVPADAGVRARVKAKYDLPERFLLSLGTLEPRKNLKILLSAYAAVAASAPLPTLVLAGNRGWLDGDIQAMVQALQDAGRVRWLGFVAQEDLPSLYALSELFVFVPTYEGFGMPVREAALCGASVLASDIPSVREAGGSWPRYIPPDEGSIRDALKTHAMAPAKSRASSPVRLSEIEVGSAAKFMEVLNGGTVEVRR